MTCLECPYYIEKYSSDQDIKNFIWCNKVDGYISQSGTCTDVCLGNKKTLKRISKKQRIHKYERYLKHKNHLKYLDLVSCGYPVSVTYEDKIWIKGQGYVPNPKPYYKRWYRGSRSKWLKQQSNKKNTSV